MGKSKKAPFFYYCIEMKNRNKDIADKSMAELVELFSEPWNGLSAEERLPYVAMSKAEKGKKTKAKLYDSFGRCLKTLDDEMEEKKRYHDRRKKDISYRVSESLRAGDLTKRRFHILYINVWTTTQEGDVFPCELGLAEATLEDGIVSVFHQMIHPGNPPLGYKGDMMENSRTGHGLWLNDEGLSKEYNDIVEQILKILRIRSGEFPAVTKNGQASPYLPIYVPEKQSEVTPQALDWLFKAADLNPQAISLGIYELHHFFWELLSQSSHPNPVPTLNIANTLLERDVFLYIPGLACRFHEDKDNPNCAAAWAKRLAFMLFDVCCSLYGVDLEEGRHLPPEASTYSGNSSSFLSPSCEKEEEYREFYDMKNVISNSHGTGHSSMEDQNPLDELKSAYDFLDMKSDI